MVKRVFIVHGWGGYPEEGWFPWLKQKLESRGFSVFVPQLPDADTPRIEKWVPALAKAVGTADAQTFFVGHSMGCQTIARYLESLHGEIQVGGAVFVAGFFKHIIVEDEPEAYKTERLWMEASLDLVKVKNHLPKAVAIFSDDDPYVPLDNQNDFRDKLGAKIIIEHAKKHFSGGEGTIALPVALNAVLEMAE